MSDRVKAEETLSGEAEGRARVTFYTGIMFTRQCSSNLRSGHPKGSSVKCMRLTLLEIHRVTDERCQTKNVQLKFCNVKQYLS